MKPILVALAIWLGVGTTPVYASPAAQSPEEVIAAIQEAAARYGASASRLVSVARCETGGTFNTRAVGDRGTSFGAFQLHSPGLLDTFYERGYSDPFNIYEAADFAAWAFSRGLGWHWHC